MKQWRFLSNQNSTIVGINDAGIETFTANMNRSLVREIIQNSLDAAIDGCTEPVEVEFVQFNVFRENIPDVEELQKALTQKKIEMSSAIILSQSKKSIENRNHKTKDKSIHEKGLGGRKALIKVMGKGLKICCICMFDQNCFLFIQRCSWFIVFTISFEDKAPGDWTTGVGYYSEDKRFVAINELAEFDINYNRVDSGTDIYILGMHNTDNFEDTFIKAVLVDFLVSLVNKKLVVRIQDKIIDSSTLPKYMSKLNPYESEEIKALLEYYHILTSHDPKVKVIKLDSTKYGKQFGFKDGECTLYLKEDEGLNRKIMITRRAGMRILEQNRISGSIDFTGVLVIEGDNMNEAFKKMEVPSHDAWEPGRVRGQEKKFNNILLGLRKYLRETVKDLFGKVTSSSMDALGASDFLPDKATDEEEEKLQKDEMSTRIKSLEGRTIEPSKEKSKNVDAIEEDWDYDVNDDNENGDKPGYPAQFHLVVLPAAPGLKPVPTRWRRSIRR
ncbi:MAG: hypothetical protein ACLRPW_06595 [Intestinibacter sp.]